MNIGRSDNPVDEVLSRLKKVRQSGGGYTAQCPNHDDRENSLSVGVGSDRQVLLKCFAGCPVEKIVASIGLSMRDLFAKTHTQSRITSNRKRPIITVEELAQHKSLPAEFLARLGLENCGRGVLIPYHLADGSLAPRKRVRSALSAKDGSYWMRAKGPIVPYGLDRLADARRQGFLIILEGESDCWTLWHHGFPALGLPGASMAEKLETSHLTGLQRIYVAQEPDRGGAVFTAGVASRLPKIGWLGDVLLLALPGVKDASDLHKRDAEAFRTVFEAALRVAQPLAEAFDKGTATVAPAKAYKATATGLLWLKPTYQGQIPVHLTNFNARIVEEVVEDDGAEVRRRFMVEATLDGESSQFPVAASDFVGMNWHLEHLGANATVLPGSGSKDHARAAIQLLSDKVPRRTVFAHVGWRKLDNSWVYLHVGGAIGPSGNVPNVEVTLPDSLRPFLLVEARTTADLVAACRSSMRLLDLAADTVIIPLFAAIWRAPLGSADFSEFFCGPTGVFKTEITALAMQHFGAGFDSRHLPAGWSSTGNALEALAFAAKDAPLVIDDFAPAGSAVDVQRYHREADRVLRGQGNNLGRQRLRADASLKPTRPPRGLIISTGEDIPRGQSLRARVFVMEVEPKDVDQRLLTECQAHAANGVFVQAMAGYLRWLAPQCDEMRQILRSRVASLRTKATGSVLHRRTPEIVANLGVGLEFFFRFAQEIGAISAAEASKTLERCWEALGKAAHSQAIHQRANDPVQRFFELLSSALNCGRAHVAAADGGEPNQPEAWGWRSITVGTGDNERQEWRPQGSRVGWIDGENLFLDLDSAHAAVQEIGRNSGDALTLASRTLSKRLDERGLLKSKAESRETLKVRRTLEGRRREVLHLDAGLLLKCVFTESDQGSQNVGAASPGSDWSAVDHRPTSDKSTLSTFFTGDSGELVGLVRSDDQVGRSVGSQNGAEVASSEMDRVFLEMLDQLPDPTNPTTAEPTSPPEPSPVIEPSPTSRDTDGVGEAGLEIEL
jgi:hypothetical protein